jgi:hypothetical protein
LLSCESGGLLACRFHGLAGGLAAFLAAFVVYRSLAYGVTAATESSAEHFTAPVVSRIFFVNLCAFAALLILKAAGAAGVNRCDKGIRLAFDLEAKESLTKGES